MEAHHRTRAARRAIRFQEKVWGPIDPPMRRIRGRTAAARRARMLQRSM